jgi:lipid II:glycine glycyltransferase (peptidoglycan interpeptide bridge formation enzyme)
MRQYYLYCPYGPTFNRELEADGRGAVVNFLLGAIKKDYPTALFLKLEPARAFNPQPTNCNLQPSSHIQPGSTLLLDLTKNEEQLQTEMHPKTRYNIRVANKHGVLVKTGSNIAGPETEEILSLITKTTERQAYKGHSLSYYRNFCTFFSESVSRENSLDEMSKPAVTRMQVRYYAASYQENLLSGGLFVDFGKTRTYLYGGSNDAQKNIMAPYALHWHAIKDAKQGGMGLYDFGGLETSSGATPGFARFKLGFGGEQIIYPKPVDTYWNKLKYSTYKIAKKALR